MKFCKVAVSLLTACWICLVTTVTGQMNRPATIERKDQQVATGLAYCDDQCLMTCIKEVFGKEDLNRLASVKGYLAYDVKAASLDGEVAETFIDKALAILSRAASLAPANRTYSIKEILPASGKPDASAVFDEKFRAAQKHATQLSGNFKAGGMGGEFVGLLPTATGLLSEARRVGRGSWFSGTDPVQSVNVQENVTILSLEATPPGSGNWSVTQNSASITEGPQRKHLFFSQLPSETLLLDGNQQLLFPLGAGSRYRFCGISASCFDDYVFVGYDRIFPLTFVLLADRGLTYLHGKGRVYKSGRLKVVLPPER